MKTLLLYLLLGMSILYSNSIVKDFEDAIALSESSKMPVLVVFSAEWCKYCSLLKKDIDNGEYSKELDKYIVCFVDVDKRADLKKEYRVSTIPDSRIIKDQKEQKQIIGYDKTKYKKWLQHGTR